MSYYWTKEKINAVKEVAKYAESYLQMQTELKQNYNIATTADMLTYICSKHKIKRPLISANHGGYRQGCGRPKIA